MKKTVFTTLVVLMLAVLSVFAMPMATAESESTDNINATLPVLAYDAEAAEGEIVDVNGVLYYQENGKNVYKGLFLYKDGNYYYAKGTGALAVNVTVNCTKTSCDWPTGSYRFDEQGRACNGIFESNGQLRYYENGRSVQKGFFKYGDDYYYAKAKGVLVTGVTYMPADTNCDLPAGVNYRFDDEGKLYQGVYDIDGVLTYYKNGRKSDAGLVKVGEDYYYAKGSGIIVISERAYATKTSCDLPANANYYFDADGKAYQGIYEINSKLYYYKNGRGTNVGLFLHTDGKYYFAAGSGLLIVDRVGYNAYKTSCDLPAGIYDFDATGAVIGHGANVETPECKHEYVATTTPATCVQAGKTVYTCSKCADTYEEVIPATGKHDYASETFAPTCTEEGKTVYTCTVCGDTYEGNIIPANGHNYSSEIISATCVEDGKIIFTCTVCGDSYEEPIPAPGHNYVDGVCTNCGEKDPSAIEHDHSHVEDIEYKQNHFSVVIGTDVNEFIEKNIIGMEMTIHWNDGCTETAYVTWDMIGENHYDFSEIGMKTYCCVSYMYEGGGYSIYMYATVIEDMGDAKLLGTYTVTDENYPWSKVELYDNGKLFADGQQSEYQILDSGLIVYEYQGVLVVMVMDNVTMTMWGYVPSEGDDVIGTYTMVDGPAVITVVVYGKYNGAGDYVAFMTQTYTNPSTGEQQSMSITTVLTLDLESRTMILMGEELIINDDNTLSFLECDHRWTTEVKEPTCTESGYTRTYCTKCGEQNGPTSYTEALGHIDQDGNGVCDRCGNGGSSTIENTRKEIMSKMNSEWKKLISEFGDLSEYSEAYNKYYGIVKSTNDENMIKVTYSDFLTLVQTIRNELGNACQHTWTTEVQEPSCTMSGYERVYCTQCGEQKSYTSLSPIGFHEYGDDGLCVRCGNLNPEVRKEAHAYMEREWNAVTEQYGKDALRGYNTRYVQIGCAIDGATTMEAIEENLRVFDEMIAEIHQNLGGSVVDPVLVGTYYLAAGNTFGWTTVELYDNGQLLASDGNWYSYNQDGALLTVFVDGIPMVMAITVDWYIPQGNVIATYTYSPSLMGGVTALLPSQISYEITVYGDYCGAGDYFARVKQIVNISHGMTATMEMTTVVTLNLERNTLNAAMFSKELYIQGNTLYDWQVIVPTLCMHNNHYTNEVNSATCQMPGVIEYWCNDCGVMFRTATTPLVPCQYNDFGQCVWCGGSIGDPEQCKHNNTYSSQVIDPTCQREGLIEYYCNDCGKFVNKEALPTRECESNDSGYCIWCGREMGGETECKHESVDIRITTSPTCTSTGWTDCYCLICGEYAYGYDIPMLPHSFVGGKCSMCGMPGGEGDCQHWYQDKNYQPATCTEPGFEQVFCCDCGVIIFSYQIEPYGHDISAYRGYCYRCGYECKDIHEAIRFVSQAMDTRWEQMSYNYELTEEEALRYRSIKQQFEAYTITDYEQLGNLYDEFEQLCTDIYNSRNDVYQGCSLNPDFDDSGDVVYEVAVGSSVEEFLQQFIGKTLYLKFSLSGVVEITITEDMIDASYLDFSEVGEAYFQIRYEYRSADGAIFSGSYGVDICVAPDMSEAVDLGTYTISGMDPNWEMTELTLFSNGWMKLFLEGGEYVCYVEYEMDGNVVLFDLMGEGIFILELNEEDGTFYYYQPAEDALVGSYGYDGGTVELYAFGEGHVVRVIFPMEYTDGILCWMTMPCSYNAGAGEIAIPMGDYIFTLVIGEDGELYEKECEHEYVVEEMQEADCYNRGYCRERCTLCGDSNYSSTAPLGHNFDENNVCTRCGYLNGGFVDREDLENKYEGGMSTVTP